MHNHITVTDKNINQHAAQDAQYDFKILAARQLIAKRVTKEILKFRILHGNNVESFPFTRIMLTRQRQMRADDGFSDSEYDYISDSCLTQMQATGKSVIELDCDVQLVSSDLESMSRYLQDHFILGTSRSTTKSLKSSDMFSTCMKSL